MSSTRLLIVSAAAFALGVSTPSLLAQNGSSGNGGNGAGQQERPRQWRSGTTRTSNRQLPPAIRVTSPNANRNTNANEGSPVLPNGNGGTGGSGSGGTNPPSTVSSVPPPPAERRVGLGRFRPRSGLQEPQGFSVRVEEGRRVYLAWIDTAGRETSYVVQRRRTVEQNGRGSWGGIEEVTLNANSEAFSDLPSEPGHYAYRIAAASTNGRSWFSAWMTLYLSPEAFVVDPQGPGVNTPPEPNPTPTPNPNPNGNGNGNGNGSGNPNPPTPPPPPVPPNMPAEAMVQDTGNRAARVQWQAVSGATQYQLERSPALPQGSVMLGAGATQFVDNSGVGVFEYRVRAIGQGGPSRYTGWLSVTVADITPDDPSGLSAASLNDGERVRLTWTDSSDNETGFRIERQTRDGSTWTEPSVILTSANRSEQIDVPGLGEHRYRIASFGSAGASSATDWVSVTVTQPEVNGNSGTPEPFPYDAIPNTPGSFAAVGISGARARVTWADGSPLEAAFQIERSPAFPEGRKRIDADATQFVDDSGPGTFAYRVRAVNPNGSSEWTSWAMATVVDVAPQSPSGLTAAHAGDNQRVNLSWNDNSTNETSFRVERESMVSGAWASPRSFLVPANAQTQIDEPGAGEHRYRIAAANAAGLSTFTGWTTVNVPAAPVDPSTVPPATPGNLGASDQNRRASVIWSDASNNELGFEIERDPSFPSRVLLSANVTGYMDNCGPGTMRYRVRSYNNAGYSDWTPWTMVQVAETAPGAPSNASASDVGNQQDVTLSWTDNSFNETAFRVERTVWASNNWGSPTTMMVEANDTAFEDSPGLGRFRYRVQALNDGGESGWSEPTIVSVTDGWTPITRSPDTREVFVSSSTGNDTNSGLSPDQPVRSLLRGYQLLRDNMPDHLRLKRGDVWTNEVVGPWGVHGAWDKNGRSAAEPMVVYYYGESPDRPLLRTGQLQRGLMMMGDGILGNIQFHGLHFQAHTRMIDNPDYVPNDGGQTPPCALFIYGQGSNFLIEDCKFEAYTGHLQFQVPNDQLVNGWELRDITVRRSVLVDAYAGPGTHSSGVFASNVNGLTFDEVILDHNGWSETVPNRPSTIFNHNFYLVGTCTNVMVKNSITSRAAATGIQMRGQAMHAFNNLALKNPLGITAGHAQASWPAQGWTGSMKYNVVLDAADVGVFGQPSFAPRGFGLNFNRSISGVIENNIVAHNTSSRGSEPALATDLASTGITIRDNILYNWTGQIAPGQYRGGLFRMDTALPSNAVVEDNVFRQPVSGFVTQIANTMNNPGGQWARNRYHSVGNPENQWFIKGVDVPFNFASWVQRSGETNGQNTPPSFPDPDRTIAGYMAHLGMTPTLEAFLSEAREQSRNNWRPEFTAAAVNRWIREGFGMAEPDPALGNPPRQ